MSWWEFRGFLGDFAKVSAGQYQPSAEGFPIPDIIHPPKNPDNPFEPSGIPRGRLLQDYLKGWYKTNKDTYWYDYHKVRDGELFSGYWAFETAIFTLLLHADMEGQPLQTASVVILPAAGIAGAVGMTCNLSILRPSQGFNATKCVSDFYR